ncbi:unnamed protein product [Pleuronectes platessa]|uniref:Uncharacterized protein n=1 Tax=Pleuronectes platessa TaxID=8262 RepID=A0A9N7TSC3_PLEPL|nr:unnamed protein product [Pleuronectes platessa]
MPKRKCSFTDELLKSFPAFRPGRDKWEALCTVCKAGTYVSVSNGGARDLKIHLDTEKHKTAVRGEETSQPLHHISGFTSESTAASPCEIRTGVQEGERLPGLQRVKCWL